MTDTKQITYAPVRDHVLEFLQVKTKHSFPADHDIFQSGVASSMFAMELVVYLESTYGVSIVGSDLRLDNFRTAERISELVVRLHADTE